MKALYKNMGIGSVILFTIGIIVAFYCGNMLPTQLAETLKVTDKTKLVHLNQTVLYINLILGFIVLTGLAAFAFMLISSTQSNSKLGYQLSDSGKHGNNSGQNSGEMREEDIQLNQRLLPIEKIIQAGHASPKVLVDKVLSGVCKDLEASQAALYVAKRFEDKRVIELLGSYAYQIAESKAVVFEFGEGLAGQVAKEGKLVNIKNVPGGYITVLSGLGGASPNHLIILPIVYQEVVVGVMEVASFQEFTAKDEKFLSEIGKLVGNQLAETFVDQQILHMERV
jgi:putative methionine-R-sulfoxide reductase with GAF domain